MYPINDREYLKICADIASLVSISLSSAKKKVELEIAKKGLKTIDEKRKTAKDLFNLLNEKKKNGFDSVRLLDDLMGTNDGEDNFLTED